jgi:tetratricopeptide (TPR) repeat protein
MVGPLIALAAAQYADGRIGDATASIDRAVAMSEAAYGKDHWGSMSARIEQIGILDASGKADEAVEIAEELLATAGRALGPEDIRYPGVLDAVARVYFPAGRRVEAVDLLLEAVRLHEAGAGALHPSTLIFMSNLTAALLFSGRTAEAEATGRVVVARNEDVLGPDHPQLVSALLGLAQAIREQGRFAEAAPIYQRALELAERHELRGQKLGAVQFNYATALWDGAIDRARALDLAGAALRTCATAQREGWDLTQDIDEIRSWLNERERGP